MPPTYGQNHFSEEDPRHRDQGPAPVPINADLSIMTWDVTSGNKPLPTLEEILAVGATLEELLTELWSDCYNDQIEPDPPVVLASMSAMRRAKVEKWRQAFIRQPLIMIRQAPHARNIVLVNLREIWQDFNEIRHAGG